MGTRKMEILNESLERHAKAIKDLFPKTGASGVYDVRGLKSYDNIGRCDYSPCLVLASPGEFQPEEAERLYEFCKKQKLRSIIIIREFKENANRTSAFIQFFAIAGLIAKESGLIHEVGDPFPFLYVKYVVGENSAGGIRSDFQIKCKLVGFLPVAGDKQACPEILVTATESIPVPTTSELKLICAQLTELEDCGGENYFLGSLSDISEVNQDSPDLFSNNTFAYNDLRGFGECREGLKSGLVVECDTRRLDRNYGLEWARALHRKYYSSTRLTSRQVRLMVVKRPPMGDQTLAGAFYELKARVSRRFREMEEKLGEFEILKTPGQDIIEAYVRLLRHDSEMEAESIPQPPRILYRAFNFIVKWESEYFEPAGKFIDGIIQLHSLVAASIARMYFDPLVGGVIAGMFDKRPHTELGNWMDELKAAKAAFDNQIMLFASGKNSNISGRIAPLILPSVGRLYDTSVCDVLAELQQTRNRKFAHAGALSHAEKQEVMLATKDKILKYLRLTEPFWSCLDLAMVCQVKPSSELKDTGCSLDLIRVCSDDHAKSNVYCPGSSPADFKPGTIVIVNSEKRFGPVPLLPLYYLQKRSLPDSEHIYFLSNKAKDGKYYEFNSYTGAPAGVLKISEDDPSIGDFVENLKQVKGRKVTAEFVVTRDGDRYLLSLVCGSNYAVLDEPNHPFVYDFFTNQGSPVRFKRDNFKPIPPDGSPDVIPKEMWRDGMVEIGIMYKSIYDRGRDFAFFLGISRVHSVRCLLELV